MDADATDAGMASYVDVLLRSQPAAADAFAIYEWWARSLAHAAAQAPFPQVQADFVIRPALVYGQQTFAVTAYLYALGETANGARHAWAAALAWMTAALASTAEHALEHMGVEPDATMRGAGE